MKHLHASGEGAGIFKVVSGWKYKYFLKLSEEKPAHGQFARSGFCALAKRLVMDKSPEWESLEI